MWRDAIPDRFVRQSQGATKPKGCEFGFRVSGVGFKVQGLEFGVWVLGFGV